MTAQPKVGAYVESGVAMAHDSGVAAWVFDIEFWGVAGQGLSETEALAQLKMTLPREAEFDVVERIQGDEGTFQRDGAPASEAEIERTLDILTQARSELLKILQNLPGADLDRPVPQDAHFARWSTIRERAWHIADTESRYYLPSLGLPSKPKAQDLMVELRESAEHVAAVLHEMPRDMRREEGGQVWTSTKLLRRLAWHEPGEILVIRQGLEAGPRPGHEL